MLIGAYGSHAAERVSAGVQRLGSSQAEITDRGELVLATSPAGTIRRAEQAGCLCLIDGEITAAPWRADRAHAASAGCSPLELLEAWTALGEGVATGLRGDFVVLLWDDSTRRGLIIRDPTGRRPLVRATASGTLVFASEIRPLLGCLRQAPPPDRVAMAFWLANDHCWAHRTLYDGVTPLRAGALLALAEGRATERRWWRPRYAPPAQISAADAEGRIRAAVEQSIAERLRPQDRLGVLLSGGLDSSAVAALAHGLPRRAAEPVGYSAVFPDHPGTDEAERIEETAELLGIPSVRMAVRGGSPLAGALAFIDDWAAVPPTANGFFWPALLDRVRADGVSLLLGGEGGDELFGLSAPLLADRLRSARPLAALALARRLPGGERQSIATLARPCLREAAIATAPTNWLRRARRPRSVWPPEPEWLSRPLADLHRGAADPLAWKRFDGPRWWAHLAHTLTEGREVVGVSDGLRRLYERGGLRIHHPLLDLNVVELVLSLPPQLAFDPRYDRPLLRGALSGQIPERIRASVAKSDFIWVLVDGLQRDLPLVRQLLRGADARTREFVNPEIVASQLLDAQPETHPTGAVGWAIDLWRLAVAECWLRAQEGTAWPAGLRERTTATRTSFHLAATAGAPYGVPSTTEG